MVDLTRYCENLARGARAASRLLASVPTELMKQWLLHSADASEKRAPEILGENARDLSFVDHFRLTAAQIDRLRLTPEGVTAMAQGLREIAALPDPVGRVLDHSVRPNGLKIQKVGVPLGVIFFI